MPRVKKADAKKDSKAVIAALPDAGWVKDFPAAKKEHAVVSELEHAIAEAEAEEAPIPDPVPVPVVPAPPPLRPCALESAPKNSKATVGTTPDGAKEARLTTPAHGTIVLPPEDVMWTLPVGAKIHKLNEGQYAAVQQKETGIRPMLVSGTAREAIATFVAHFHPRGA